VGNTGALWKRNEIYDRETTGECNGSANTLQSM
jgi:hypothetical protein